MTGRMHTALPRTYELALKYTKFRSRMKAIPEVRRRGARTSRPAAGYQCAGTLRGFTRPPGCSELSLPMSHPVVLFDGVCNLCNGFVDFLLKRDTSDVFRFAALQSDAASEVLAGIDLPPSFRESIVLVENGSTHVGADAVLRIAGRLRFPWRLVVIGYAIPRPLREAIYRRIAVRRYEWFGRRPSCRVPLATEKGRFLK